MFCLSADKTIAALALDICPHFSRLTNKLAMASQKSISNRVLLGAIFFGLNLLCFMGIVHGRHAERHARVNYSQIPAHRAGRAGSRGKAADGHTVTGDSVIDGASQASSTRGAVAGPVVMPQAALVTVAVSLPRPTTTVELLARENVMALGSAPRAPGLGRAPPVA